MPPGRKPGTTSCRPNKCRPSRARHWPGYDVEQGELALKQAETDLGDFQERLSETGIIAPSDGMLLTMMVKKGSVIASASTSFTGGDSAGPTC